MEPVSLPTNRSPVGVAAFTILATIGAVATVIDFAAAAMWHSFVTAALGVVASGLTLLAGYEAWSLTGAAPPLTWLERWAHARHQLAWPLMTLAIGLAEGTLAGHFWWSVCPPFP